MTKNDALNEINQTQDYYVSELIKIINGVDNRFENLKEINFTSPTGTGKTVMVSKLINKLPDTFFVITTLSKGQLKYQIESKIKSLSKWNNFIVFGLNDYTTNTRLKSKDIINCLPNNKRIIWIRDEGHIATNRWQEVLRKRSSHIINFSATNKDRHGIQCNFTHTMMLRTVTQCGGTPEEALDKLIEIKRIHQKIKGYNPCALFRLFYYENVTRVISECQKRGLKCINITTEDFDMEDICSDDNEYDVIINKLKITEGIDLKRCHVIYMDNKPKNEATVVQIIGRARRNALFWRNDVDILSKSNEKLLNETRRCFVFYNNPDTEVEQNSVGELTYALCDIISIESLKSNISIYVKNGQLQNGLFILELIGKTGNYFISYNEDLECNIINNEDFYKTQTINNCENNVIDLSEYNFSVRKIKYKENAVDFFERQTILTKRKYDKYKFWYYLFKIKLLKEKKDFPFSEFEEKTRMDDKDVLVDSAIFNNLLLQNKASFEFSRLRGVEFLNYREYFEDAKEYAKIIKHKQVESRQLLTYWDGNKQSVHINYDFIPFIEEVEYIDFALAKQVREILLTKHNVFQISSNKYKVSNHPFTEYLVQNRGIRSIEELKKTVYSAKGTMVLLAKTDVWKKMLTTIKSFKDIDNYEVKYLTLSELNEQMNLGLSERNIKVYVGGHYPTKVVSGDKYSNDYLYYWNKKELVPKPLENRKLVIYRSEFTKRFKQYRKIINDFEIAAIGTELMKYSDHHYVEDKPVTSKINQYCKFNRFITKKYDFALSKYGNQTFNGQNNFDFDRLCNSCLGFCVEYLAKMKIYGDETFKSFLDSALSEARETEPNDLIRIRAAMLAYRQEMIACYGNTIFTFIPAIRIDKLIKQNYRAFVEKVIELGNKTAVFVKRKLYANKIPKYDIDPNLSVNHISALCDFITDDTILDLKCTSSITVAHLKQVLSYHYLSTKRSDLNIKRVIVYDAVTGKDVTIDLS